MFSIGDLSRRTGVKVPTIRYYEQMGLVAAPERSDGNQRRYGRQELERLAFVRHARDLGFGVDDIRALIELSGHPDQPCGHADSIAAEQLASVREKIARLKRLETELERIATCCDGKTVGDCYVIRALSDHALCADDHA
ncbi:MULTISPECIES: helix-turn-helix domain-containing protein [unclassified Mesorhizobium]|jgi:DNA-binding transcriptional MerR regulator|uniref:MerR family transcriptional regulator n=1 Tax=unclassified Mesorhizobium TaxID=325217 RepID=UPI00086A833B|nr:MULTISPECIES: helix-turn-helix domain-containing protein [unclassified Mesorhizobium]MBN9254004.1 helix-turn-helix domain-containing protein [Mesorhizobium sp.]MBN9272278.1 helix-turn-helix domain-containing protein [Mesorhizobium sp.]ODT19087.1 MAG: MerR family transcriptional regulator [Mesorhizobium sp. SCN 65-12]OJX71207.1 MAG: MerR family transcriptional regulator [Mesorhizobium sp. 65-26]